MCGIVNNDMIFLVSTIGCHFFSLVTPHSFAFGFPKTLLSIFMSEANNFEVHIDVLQSVFGEGPSISSPFFSHHFGCRIDISSTFFVVLEGCPLMASYHLRTKKLTHAITDPLCGSTSDSTQWEGGLRS